jgi:tetratricopeptide (TPR) repeat protein
MKRTILAAFLFTGLGTPALADEVDTIGGRVTELDARIYELNQQLKPPPEPGPQLAENRLIDAQVLYELKNYEAASIILFDVVEKYANSPAYPEALFYLADSLYLKRDYLSSRRFFEKIVEQGPVNPRYQESLERLVELSLHTGDYSPVDGYIAKLDQLAASKPLPSVPYVKGKYFYFRRQFDKSLEALKAIQPGHVYYFHATYFVGANYVAMGADHLDDAIQAFGTILKNKPETDSQKRITELAHMALGRVYLERGQLTQSLDEYSKINSKSDQFNDMLYESAWVHIKGKDYLKARRQLDLLLLNAPDTPLAPEVKLLIGNLHIRQDEFGPATDAFTKTRDEFDPIRKQLSDELQQTVDPNGYFKDLIAKNLDKFDLQILLPSAAERWVKEEADVVKLSTLIGDETELKRSLNDGDEIVNRLEKTLNGPQRVNVFPELANQRARATEISNQLTEVKQKLAQRDAALIGPVAGGEKAQLDELDKQRTALEQKLGALPAKEASMRERQAKVRSQYNDLDRKSSEQGTQAAGLKTAVQAAIKLYEQESHKLMPPAQPVAAAAPAPAPPAADNVTYAQKVGDLQKRIDENQAKLEAARVRVEKLKELVLKAPAQTQNDIDGARADVETLIASIENVRHDILDAATTIGVDDSDMQAATQLRAQYEELLKKQHQIALDVRSRLGGSDHAKAEQIESILERARAVDGKVGAFNQRIDELLDARLKDIQSTLADEKAHMTSYRGTLVAYQGESSDVGGAVVADNFRSVAQRFYNIVVRSDVGIIDVAWALKDRATKEDNRLVAERKRELKLLDDEFKDVLKESP